MKKLMSVKVTGVIAALLLGLGQWGVAADNLETTFKATGWDKLIGTWGDGTGNTSTFAWKFPGTVVESLTKMGDTQRFSMIYRNSKTGVISVVSTDNKGGSSKGDCEFSAGKAVFKITTAPHDGTEANLVIHYILDGDTLEVKVEGRGEGTKMTRQ
jgi:hypothetical protein